MEKDLNRHLAIREIGVAIKYMKRRSVSHVSREIQTETTLRSLASVLTHSAMSDSL